MKKCASTIAVTALAIGAVSAQDGLYSVGLDEGNPLPLTWIAGASVIFDDNVGAGRRGGVGAGTGEESTFAINPSVGVSFVNVRPQTTIDVFARLGLIYYFDAPAGIDDLNSQSRLGFNLTHRYNERLRFVSRNFVSYELEPDYARGFASARTAGEFFFWQTDNSIGYRWTERFGTYTGIRFTGTTFTDVENNDRMNIQFYNQSRYQLTPVTVLTADYRYGIVSGDNLSSDSTQQFFLLGVEHRFSPNTIGILRGGAQVRDVDDGSSIGSPYLELAFRTNVNDQFRVRSFARYGMEFFDTVQFVDIDADGVLDPVEYDDRRTLRFGVSAEYAFTPMLSFFGGIDYIPTSFNEGRALPPALPGTGAPDLDEDLINLNVGMSFSFTETVTGTVAYTFTDSSSDIVNRDYDRNRVSAGVFAQF